MTCFTPDTLKDGNICVIWVDDMIDIFTWRNAFGVPIQTPNIDRLMGEGVRFSNAYATVPLCAPCRAELATGISPFKSGLVDLNKFWRDIYPPERAWAYDLRRSGFQTFTTGKVDANYKPMPDDVARVLFHQQPVCKDRPGKRTGVNAYLDRGPGIKGINHPQDDGTQDATFYDYHVAQNAIKYLRKADGNQRHLIQLGFKHPHYNLDCPDRFYQAYDVDAIHWPKSAAEEDYYGPPPNFGVYEAAYIAHGAWIPEKAGDAAWRQVVRAYFAAISHVDHEIGRFMDALRTSKFADNTTVIFLSDNGFNLGTHDSFHKMSQWDSAAHIPLGIWHAGLDGGQVVDLPVSLHNIPKTVMDIVGLPYRPDWTSGQSLLPLIDDRFGEFDRSKSPITSVFGTLSVRPSTEGLTQYRYFRYPNGEEHVYDLEADPGETENLIETAPMDTLRDELVRGAWALGLDIRDVSDPADAAQMASPNMIVRDPDTGSAHTWAYGPAAEVETQPDTTLWYMAGPDDFDLQCPTGTQAIRVGAVVARDEESQQNEKTLKVIADPQTAMTFEAAERVNVEVIGSNRGDTMYGPKYHGSTFYGGDGDDHLVSKAKMTKNRHAFYGGAGNDTLIGGPGRDLLDGGTGDDFIYGNGNNNQLFGGHGNDHIFDGERSSHIHTGPGRNIVVSDAGDDVIVVGPGCNDITPGPGNVKFQVAYGGATLIQNWRPEYSIDVSSWPDHPTLEPLPDQTGVRLRLGYSMVDIVGATDLTALEDQIIWETA